MRKMPKPMSLDVQTRLVFNERVLGLVEDALAIKTDDGEGVEGGPARPARQGRARR